MFDNLRRNPTIEEKDNIFLHHPIRAKNCVVFICVNGSMRIKVNLVEYQIVPNDILTVLASNVMEVIESTIDTHVAVISFSDKYFTPLFGYMEEFMGISNMIYNNPLSHLTEDVMQELIDIYTKMKNKLQQKDNPFRRFALKAYSYVLCSMALEQFTQKPVEKISNSSRPVDLYNRFMRLLQKDFKLHRDIKYYARELNISPKYFSSIIKKISGKTAGEWIDEYVLLEARILLKTRQYTIQQVSDTLSFPSQSSFAKYFKAHIGCTPSHYQTSPD